MKYFKLSEFDCKETGENEMDEDFLAKLDILREMCGFPFVINSGFRSVNHSVERNKNRPGVHTRGIAADIRVTNGVQRAEIIRNAFAIGLKGLGVHKDFIHVDDRDFEDFVMWPY